MNMKKSIYFLLGILVMLNVSCKPEVSTSSLITHAMERANIQYKHMVQELNDSIGMLPRTYINGQLMLSDSRWWCSGFFPGSLWYLYEYSQDSHMKQEAEKYTERVRREMYTTDNHDIGFMIFCSFGNGYRLTGNKDYKQVIDTACQSLVTRYRDHIGLIRSWDFNRHLWQYPVIIDNMMNLEMLLWGAETFQQPYWKEIAESHAKKTMLNHYRPDYSCFHLVSYDTISGQPELKQTFQGAADESSWSRGQAWGLYGYTFMYRFTKDSCYLNQARQIANYMINHPNMPANMIPYWDYNAPNIPAEERDASAAALMASALIELSDYVNEEEQQWYLDVAEQQIRTLCSDEYLAAEGENGNFILKHSVGSKPHMADAPYYGEVDAPLSYADYYFLEALVRWTNKFGK